MNDGSVKLELLSEISEDSHEHAEIELLKYHPVLHVSG